MAQSIGGKKRGQPKGSTGNPNGRPKGAIGKVTGQVKQIFADIFENNKEKIQSDIDNLSSKDRLAFMVALLPYVVPRMPVEVAAIPEAKPVGVEGVSTKELNNLITEAVIIKDED